MCARARWWGGGLRLQGPATLRTPPYPHTPLLSPLPSHSPASPPLHRLGVETHLKAVYGSLLTAPRAGASVSLRLDAAALPAGVSAAELALRVSQLRMHVQAFPFLNSMAAVAGGRGLSEAPCVLQQRPREAVYLLTRADRVLAIYHLDVAEPTDRAIARVVAQELTEAYRAVNSAPPVAWSERELPMELKGFPGLEAPAAAETSIGYLTFTIFPAGYKTEAQREAVASQLSLFRSYLQYHLKAAKTYLHARMRSRAENLQKILNRAIPDDPFADKDKKLASGRSFKAASAPGVLPAAGRLAGGGGSSSSSSSSAEALSGGGGGR
jgi:actin related protein 2/3 complex subunit 2